MTPSVSPQSVFTYRRLLLVAGVVYLLWWVLVDQLLPTAFNPLPGRIAVSASFVVIWAASYRSALVREYLRGLYALCATLLTAHYYYLYANNADDSNWLGGSYVTVIALGVTLELPVILFAYSAFVVAAAFYVSTLGSSVVSLPGTVTVLFLINAVGWIRRRADEDRRLRAKAESEKEAADTVTRAKMLFLANINHELRTPLAGILGFADLLARAPLAPDDQLFVERIGANARALLATVEQILALTSSEATPLRVKSEPVDLMTLLEGAIAAARPKAQQRNLGLALSFEGPIPKPVSDAGLIGYVLGNLLDNALKFTSEGAVHVIARAAKGAPDLVEVLVVDTGIGMAAAEWQRVFDPFIQVQAGYDRAYGGSGVGLTVARRLARILGGDVEIAESREAKGTTMRFFFPLVVAAPGRV